MELKKGTDDWEGWWAVVRPEKRIIEYLRRSVPTTHRQFDSVRECWYVHDKYVESVRQLMNSAGKPANEEDPWAVLHLRPGAPPAIIKAVWRVLAAELHPDRGGDPQQFIRAKSAYERLTKV